MIGSHIADQLVELGIEEIVILDNFTRGAHSNLAQAISHGRVKLIEGDIRDRNLVMEVMKGIDLGVPSSSDSNIDEQVEMLVRVYSALGDQCYLRRDYPKARENYMAALQHDPSAITTWAKFTILRLGRLGIRIRDLASSI